MTEEGQIMFDNVKNSVEGFVLEPEMVGYNNQFISIDGVDCSGKGSITQIIEKKGIDNVKIKRVDFPQYDLSSGAMIKSFLNGDEAFDYTKYMQIVGPAGLHPVEWHAILSGRFDKLIDMVEFISRIYSINRIEYFMKNNIEPNTIYIFDRFQYSNVIHQFSNIASYLIDGEAKDLFAIRWRASKEYRDFTYQEFVKEFVYKTLDSLIYKMLNFEKRYGVPDAYKFLLLIEEAEVLDRISKRKESKHEGIDILEKNDSIHRACKFVNNTDIDFHIQHGCVPISLAQFNYDNEAVADYIINSYKQAVRDNLEPGSVFSNQILDTSVQGIELDDEGEEE